MTSQLVLHKIVGTLLVFAFLYAVYTIKGDKPIIYPYFWRTLHYISIWGAFLMFSIFLLPLRDSSFITLSLWSCIIFFAFMVLLNVYAANFDTNKFKEFINSRTIGLVITILIGLEFAIVGSIELWDKLFK